MEEKRKRGRPKGKPVPLNYRSRLFVSFYLGDCKGNAVESARRAGYAFPEQVGCRLLQRRNIKTAIESELGHIVIKPHEIFARWADMATANIGDFLIKGKDETDEPRWNWHKIKKYGYLFKSIDSTPKGLAPRLHDAVEAQERMARLNGMTRNNPQYGPEKNAKKLSPEKALYLAKVLAEAESEFDERERLSIEGPSDFGGDPRDDGRRLPYDEIGTGEVGLVQYDMPMQEASGQVQDPPESET